MLPRRGWLRVIESMPSASNLDGRVFGQQLDCRTFPSQTISAQVAARLHANGVRRVLKLSTEEIETRSSECRQERRLFVAMDRDWSSLESYSNSDAAAQTASIDSIPDA